MNMVKVFDPWVKVPGRTLHFDVMSRDEATALRLANEYVAGRGLAAVSVTAGMPLLSCGAAGPV